MIEADEPCSDFDTCFIFLFSTTLLPFFYPMSFGIGLLIVLHTPQIKHLFLTPLSSPSLRSRYTWVIVSSYVFESSRTQKERLRHSYSPETVKRTFSAELSVCVCAISRVSVLWKNKVHFMAHTKSMQKAQCNNDHWNAWNRILCSNFSALHFCTAMVLEGKIICVYIYRIVTA